MATTITTLSSIAKHQDNDDEDKAPPWSWLSMQYSLPLSALPRALRYLNDTAAETAANTDAEAAVAESAAEDDALVRRRGSLLRGRVVQLKFLRGSSRTLLGPNSITATASTSTPATAVSNGPVLISDRVVEQEAVSGAVACLNVYWASPAATNAAATHALESCLREAAGKKGGSAARPHWGKLHYHPPAAADSRDAAFLNSGAEPESESESLLGGWLRLWGDNGRAFCAIADEIDPTGVFRA